MEGSLQVPGGIFGTLVGSDSGVRTFHWDSQWKVRTPRSRPSRVLEMPPGLITLHGYDGGRLL